MLPEEKARQLHPLWQRFDPQGDYVRRYVPELAHIPGKAVHEPWKHDEGYDHDYPERVVDHAEERQEALRRYDAVRGGSGSGKGGSGSGGSRSS